MKHGIHDGIPEATYHADPALSQSQAKTLLDCPARYRWELDHPREHKTVFDVGHAAHAKVLGVGAPVVVIDADSWRTKAAKDAADQARADGHVPLLRADADAVDGMAEAVLAHPGARAIFEAEGASEQSAWWEDEGVQCRARIDRLTAVAPIDLKTTQDASPDGFGRSCATFGYDLQDAAYTRAIEVLTGEHQPLVFVAVEKAAPHFVGLYTLPDEARARGQRRWLDALDLYRRCTETGTWPAYGDDIRPVTWPRWAA